MPMDKFIVFTVLLFALALSEARLSYLECESSSECPVGHCCVIGMGRFSVPKCLAVGEKHDTCRVSNNHVSNITLLYPNQDSANLTDVYYQLCPCAPGLYCSEITGACQDRYEDFENNGLYLK